MGIVLLKIAQKYVSCLELDLRNTVHSTVVLWILHNCINVIMIRCIRSLGLITRRNVSSHYPCYVSSNAAQIPNALQ